MTSAGHLGCKSCRIRVHGNAPAIELLEARCPICEVPLAPAPASSVIGFRFFDLDPFSEPGARQIGASPAAPPNLLIRLETSSARRGGDARHPHRLP